jgi:hypothetical protein
MPQAAGLFQLRLPGLEPSTSKQTCHKTLRLSDSHFNFLFPFFPPSLSLQSYYPLTPLSFLILSSLTLAHSQVDGEIRSIGLRHGAELLYILTEPGGGNGAPSRLGEFLSQRRYPN